MSKKQLAILGSTGSIGTQGLDVVRKNPGLFEIFLLTAKSNFELLVKQINEFKPKVVLISKPELALKLKQLFGNSLKVGNSQEDFCEAVTEKEVDIVLASIVGFDCLKPVISAIKAGKDIALANKECVVAAGSLLQSELAKSKSRLVPIDSEHNSIFQCLNRRGWTENVRKIILTASGGPFLNTHKVELPYIKPEDAIKHPKWNMGVKNSIDSATLMNKGLEVIEASFLFNLPLEKIDVLIHPQSIIHGLVEYQDGAVIAALYNPDMRVPIAYAINFLSDESLSRTLETTVEPLDLAKIANLTFYKPDTDKFKCLELAYRALKAGASAPTVINAANEVAVNSFLNRMIKFTDIPEVIENCLLNLPLENISNLEDVITIDSKARAFALELCK